MVANVSSLITANPPFIHIYVALAVYGLAIAGLMVYVYRKFSGAHLLLASLKQDWDSAEKNHSVLLKQAKERVSKLHTTPPNRVMNGTYRAITTDVRTQVATMGRKGLSSTDISHSCGIPEGDVEVLLGLMRIQR